MSEKYKLFIVAGERSGDLHGASLVRAMRKRDEDFEFFGIGGAQMKSAGVEVIHDITRYATIGLSDIITNAKVLIRSLYSSIRFFKRQRPSAVILIDFPEFNLRFAKRAKKMGVPVIYYISPQVWAWRTWRVRNIVKYVDKMLVILELERKFYKKYGYDVTFVGHPLLDVVDNFRAGKSCAGIRRKWNISKDAKVVGLLPGSRLEEIGRHINMLKNSAKIIRERVKDVKFLLAFPEGVPDEMVQDWIGEDGDFIMPLTGSTYEVMMASDLLITASGTATLESAIIGTPMIVIYKVPILTYCLFIKFLKVKRYSLVNIVANDDIVPEFVQWRAKPSLIASKAIELFQSHRLEKISQDLKRVCEKLGPKNTSERAGDEIVKVLTGEHNLGT